MIGVKEKLTILYFDGVSTYTDYTSKLYDYGRDSQSITLASSETIYIGFDKPINTFYVHLDQASTTDTTMTLQYYNGSSFTDVANFNDESNAFQRSGFVQWSRNQDAEAKTTINSVEQYWYALTVASDTSATIFRAINILFSDDNDLKKEFYEASRFIPSNESSHVLSHEAARDHIVQILRNDGRYKLDLSTGYLKDITAFDLLDVSQVRIASTYLVLSKIFSNASDEAEDFYSQKAEMYMSMFRNSMQNFFLFIDSDDDGVLDVQERESNVSSVLVRR